MKCTMAGRGVCETCENIDKTGFKEQMENHLNDRIFEKAIWKREHEGDRQAAIELCQKIIELDPSYSEAYFYVAVSAQELNQNDLAIDMYTQYIQRFPVGPQIHRLRMLSK